MKISQAAGTDLPIMRNENLDFANADDFLAALSPNDAERLEVEFRVWFEVLVRQPVEGDVHMRYLLIRMMIKMLVMITAVTRMIMTMPTMMRATTPTWWRRMDHSDG